jgi:hypothetical protein
MSQLQWARALTPPPTEPRDRRYDVYEAEFVVPRTLSFPCQDEQLVALPDGRAYRSLSRAGLLMAAAGLAAREAIARQIEADPFSVGIYAAIENGPNDYSSARQMVDTPPSQFAATYKALRSPKYYFKMLANVPPSQLAVFLGVMGPLYTFTHSRLACRHALEQAEWDLATSVVSTALVCTSFALDDALVAMRTRRNMPPHATLAEGAACLVLTAGAERTDWSWLPSSPSLIQHGIATDLVTVATRSHADVSPYRPGLALTN